MAFSTEYFSDKLRLHFYDDMKSPFKTTQEDSVPRTSGGVRTWSRIPSQSLAWGPASPHPSQRRLPRSSACLAHSSLAPTLPLSSPTFPWLPPWWTQNNDSRLPPFPPTDGRRELEDHQGSAASGSTHLWAGLQRNSPMRTLNR